jgi:uncharacterized protein YkwD
VEFIAGLLADDPLGNILIRENTVMGAYTVVINNQSTGAREAQTLIAFDTTLMVHIPTTTPSPTPISTPAPTPTPAPIRHEDPFHIQNLMDDYGAELAKEMFEREVFRLTNVERANHGLPALIWDDRLARAARGHSQDMSINNFVGHGGSNGSSGWMRIRAEGVETGLTNENAASGQRTPAILIREWMDSPGHRANILSPRTHLGVGTYFLVNESGNITFLRHTQKFADVLN